MIIFNQEQTSTVLKIQKTAKAAGITPKELCDINAAQFKEAWKLLDIDYSKFIRTTDDYHQKTIQDIFEKLLEKGDIYKHSYTGFIVQDVKHF